MEVCRFAPSATGPAHPGTLFAALLCWLDARSRGARLLLRLEDLDPGRCRGAYAEGLRRDLAWLGLDWDAEELQSAHGDRHAAALDALAAQGRLYPCALSRRELAASGRRAPDGAWAYDNRGRGAPLPPGGWRACPLPLRAHLPDGRVAPVDDGGLDLAQDPAAAAGDPVVRRRDGAVAYQLAVVVDDAAAGVSRVVRGRDIAPSTATQAALQGLLGLPTPAYRHHPLLLEADAEGRKFSKFHGAVGGEALRRRYSAAALCARLAAWAGLLPAGAGACSPADLLPGFAWARVRSSDLALRWTGDGLLAEA